MRKIRAFVWQQFLITLIISASLYTGRVAVDYLAAIRHRHLELQHLHAQQLEIQRQEHAASIEVYRAAVTAGLLETVLDALDAMGRPGGRLQRLNRGSQ